MLAFDFYVNGKRVSTAGIDGPGVLATHVDMARGVAPKKGKKAPEYLSLHVGGLYTRTNTHVTWLHRQLRMGDSIRIDVVDARKVDRPKKKRPETPRMRLKREHDFVMKKAASWGWKIKK